MKQYSKIINNQPGNPEAHNKERFRKNTLVEVDGQTLTVQRFDRWSDEKKKKAGYYPYEPPVFDHITEQLGELYFDQEREVVSRHVVAKQLDISAEKEKKIKQLHRHVTALLRSTDQYYVRYQERNKPIPDYIQSERDYIHSECDRMKAEIIALSDAKNVITYNYRIDNLQYHSEVDLV